MSPGHRRRALLLLLLAGAVGEGGGGARPPGRIPLHGPPAVPAAGALLPAVAAPPAAAPGPVPPLAPPSPAPGVLPPGPGRRLHRAGSVPPGPDDASRARAVLAREADRLGLSRAPGRLVLEETLHTPVGTHVRFRQEVDGLPVHGSEASVHWAPDGRVLVVNADLFPVPAEAPVPVLAPAGARAAAAAIAEGDPGDPAATEGARLLWLPLGKTARLAYGSVAVSGDESLLVFVDALDGEVLAVEDLRRSAEGSGRVFAPNPVWSERDFTLVDGDDADHPALDAALRTVPLPRLDGSGFLRGKWADLTPTKGRAFEPSLDFLYTRSDPRFEQVNVYFHIDALQEYVHGVLGYEGAAREPLKANAHAGRFDNSYYDLAKRRVSFGDGGVDDGEDGDIIVHEVGHALQDAAVRGFGRGREAGSMGEGFGDYLAASVRSSGNETWDAAVASWDAVSFATGSPPALRRVDGNKVWPGDVKGQVHADGEIWSAALRRIRALLGAEAADRVIIGSHYLLTARATLADGAAAVVAANLSLRGGADEEGLRAIFAERGLPVGDDPLEEDDGPAAANPVDRPRFTGMYAADDDWFRLEAEPGAGVTVAVLPGLDRGRPSVTLFNATLFPLAASDRFSFPATVATGSLAARTVFYLRVSPPRGGAAPYDLLLEGAFHAPPSDRFEPNGSMEAAASLPTGSAVRIHISEGDDDWFRLEGTQGAEIEIEALFDGGAVDADLALFAPDGTLLGEAATTGTPETLLLATDAAGPASVFLRARAAAGAGPVDLLAWVRPARTLTRRAVVETLAEGAEREFALPVTVAPGASAMVTVKARPFGRGGVIPEVEVISPSGITVLPFGTALGKGGTFLRFEAPESGDWRLRVRSFDLSPGRFRLKARVR